MTEVLQEKDRKRSPNYPSISLQAAVAKILKLYQKIGVNAGTKEVLAEHWDTTAKSSSFLQTMGSLGKYGLISSIAGTPKKFKLTREALDIVMLPASDAKHIAAIKRAALLPKLFNDLWEEHGADVVSDDDLNHVLVTKHDFRPDAAADAVKQYRKNIEFAKLESADNIGEEDEESALEVGDFVQWESQGAMQFKEPRRVTGKSDGGEWLFVEGSATGILAKETYKVDPPAPKGADVVTALMDSLGNSGAKNPPPNPKYAPSSPPSGFKQYVLTTDTGDTMLRWPSVLSDEDKETVLAWIDGMKKKILRSPNNAAGDGVVEA